MRNIMEHPITAAEAGIALRTAIQQMHDREPLMAGNVDALLLMKVREYINIHQKDFDQWCEATVKISV